MELANAGAVGLAVFFLPSHEDAERCSTPVQAVAHGDVQRESVAHYPPWSMDWTSGTTAP